MSLTSSKKIIFWGITILFPFLFLLLVEVGLRIGGYNEEAQELFIEAPSDSNFLVTNSSFIGRYFPAFTPTVAPNPFRKEKKPNTFRVFVFGGSSAQGFPYNFYYSFAEQLEQKLLLNTEGLTVEVINLGMTAVNSYVIRDLSYRTLPYQPDAILIYAGHNEYYGSFGVGSTQFGLMNSRRLKLCILGLKNLRLYQYLESLLKQSHSPTNDRRTLMAKVVKESDIALKGSIFRDGVEQFEQNMNDVLDLYEKEKVPVYLSTIASNLKDQAPLSDNREAIQKFEEAQSFYSNSEYSLALASFIEAKELDGIRFRAPERVNEAIRDFAKTSNVELVEVESLLREKSDSKIEDASLFIDHLHPNSKGHKLIASKFFDHLLELEIIKDHYRPTDFKVPQSVSKFEETYSNTSISRLLMGYPFQKNLSQEEELRRFDKIYTTYLKSSYIDSIAASAARNRHVVAEALTKVINEGRNRNDTLTVVSHYYELLKWQLNSTELIDKGIEYTVNNRSIDNYLINILSQILNEGQYDPRYMDVLSAVYIINGELDKAKYWLDESERMGSNTPMLYYNLARYHILKGDTVKASGYYNRFRQSQQSN
ncbi:MAG: SGNH/GDSL hydrolase family protein [Balneolaceae bacterium]|nr:SGNH/GDSL hydrolase family protein [Balneolaceae bacterium]MBO6545976.1 SGNH/GDSL hydrolase family protein [Balneolaceae bacterium]MBO6647372.1 SGNH/GDSL hydrolase family protein [Balneolaceae bacterium]